MRAYPSLLVAALAGCHPSASIENTMPLANLQTYTTIALRVHATDYSGQSQASYLQQALFAKLQQQCNGFRVVQPGQAATDLLLDLSVTRAGRGGTGWVQNQNQAFLEGLLVLTDGQSGELLTTGRVHGQSSGMLVTGAQPEAEAVDVTANSVASMLAKSGCSGARVARAATPPEPTPPGPGPGPGSATPPGPGSGSTTPPPVDDAKRAQAEALDAQGKEKVQNADLVGALAAFQQAFALVPDPRYEYNVCLTLEAQQQWDAATAACKQARGMNPAAALAGRIDHRLDLLAHHQ